MGENKKYKFTLEKMFIHLSTIIRHKHYVFINCCKCGIPWQGIVHDLSKFSPAEFWLNVKYVEPGVSPIDIQKKVVGFSFAWQHHKGRNPHHYEFWMDKFDNGCYVTRMPFKYIVESVCDMLGAGMAYNPKRFSYGSEYQWWQKQREIRAMHPYDIEFLDKVFKALYNAESDWYVNGQKVSKSKYINSILNKKHLRYLYNSVTKAPAKEYPMQVKIGDIKKV